MATPAASSARRKALALALSLAAHLGLALALTGVSLVRALSLRTPIEVELRTPQSAPTELPLGPQAEPASSPPPRPRRRPPRATTLGQAPGAPDAGAAALDGGAEPDAGPAADAPLDGAPPATGAGAPALSALGPPGARLSAVLRLDRLREPEAAAYGPLVERILRLLPDRRRLLDGSGLEPLRDFDALLVATPNPMDDAVTFLAVTHHLDDPVMQEALARAGQAAAQPIEWKEVRGRPVGLRARRGRDDRLLVLPAPGLVVVATPAYATLLLGEEALSGAERGRESEPAAPGSDAGAPARAPVDWQTLARRLAAESDLVPEGVVFLLEAEGLFAGRAAPGEETGAPAPSQALSPPARLRLTVTAAAWVEAEARASFASEAEAARWAQELPALRGKLLGNPLTALSGLTPVVAALQVEQDGARLTVRTRATRAQVEALLALVLNLLGVPP